MVVHVVGIFNFSHTKRETGNGKKKLTFRVGQGRKSWFSRWFTPTRSSSIQCSRACMGDDVRLRLISEVARAVWSSCCCAGHPRLGVKHSCVAKGEFERLDILPGGPGPFGVMTGEFGCLGRISRRSRPHIQTDQATFTSPRSRPHIQTQAAFTSTRSRPHIQHKRSSGPQHERSSGSPHEVRQLGSAAREKRLGSATREKLGSASSSPPHERRSRREGRDYKKSSRLAQKKRSRPSRVPFGFLDCDVEDTNPEVCANMSAHQLLL
jgi:hypothetical protein